jgi:O-antigen biosynthesis protein
MSKSQAPSGKVGRALWILQHEGPKPLAAKGRSYIGKRLNKSKTAGVSEAYNYLANPLFQITDADIEKSKAVQKKAHSNPKSALWFVPYFDHIAYGGIYTIFRFMEYFALQGVATTIVIYDNQYVDIAKTKAEIAQHFPGLNSADLMVFDNQKQKISELPACDIAFSTIWMSAYFLLKYNQTKHKYYFIQDYEPLFYEGGSMYALAESTYRFGFTGIVNTPGLLWAVNQRHALEGVSFVPAVDTRHYYPPAKPRHNKKVKVFFYARPKNPRNAFELGVVIIKTLLEKYGNTIEIITAGADWDETAYGLGGLITNHKLLGSLDEVGDLYRQCDIGFVYMLSKHPSYQPFEFMSCGMATVSNRNEDNLWLFKDGKNCLLAEPSATAMAEKISQLIDDPSLRAKIAKTGQSNIATEWDKQQSEIWNYIKKS